MAGADTDQVAWWNPGTGGPSMLNGTRPSAGTYDRSVRADRVVSSLPALLYRRAVTVTGPTQREVLL